MEIMFHMSCETPFLMFMKGDVVWYKREQEKEKWRESEKERERVGGGH